MHFLSKHGNHDTVSANPHSDAQWSHQSQSASIKSSAEGLLQDDTSLQQPVQPTISQANAAAKAHCLSAALIGRSPLCILKQRRQVWEGGLVAAPPLL